MSVKNLEKLEKSRVCLTLEAGSDAFEAAINKAYLKQRSKINVAGFRPGKAPRKMIESMYGAEVFYEEAVNILLPDVYEDAIKEKELKVVGYPDVELEKVDKDGCVFKCTVSVYPEVTLGEYKGLVGPKAEVNVSDEDIKVRLDELAERNARVETVEREAKQGDIVNIDFEGFDQGKPFQGGKGNNYDLELGSNSFVPGFEDQLEGMKAGDEKDIDITFPENYAEELAGKAVVFHVKANEVKQKELPAMDDEFAKDVSEFDSLAELKEDVKNKILAERDESATRAFEDVLMEQVVANMTCEVPDDMVETQQNQMFQQLQQQLASQGIPFAEYLKLTGMTDEQVKANSYEPALRQVKLELAIRALIDAEKIEASDDEANAEAEKMGKMYGMDVDTVKKYINVEELKDSVIRNKAISVVVENAKAVLPDEYKKDEKAAEEKPVKKRSTSKKAADNKEEPTEVKEKKATTKKATGEKKTATEKKATGEKKTTTKKESK